MSCKRKEHLSENENVHKNNHYDLTDRFGFTVVVPSSSDDDDDDASLSVFFFGDLAVVVVGFDALVARFFTVRLPVADVARTFFLADVADFDRRGFVSVCFAFAVAQATKSLAYFCCSS